MQATRTIKPGLLGAILDRAAAAPSAPAIEDGDRILSYAELLAAAQGVAARLLEHGAEPGEPVGVAAVRDATTVVAMLGILLADAAFVPLDPTDPPGRLAGIAHDAGLRTVVTPARHRSVFAGAGLACLVPGHETGDPRAASWGQDPGTLAYVIHTSGTTGRPKGVGIPRRALEHFSRNAVDYYEMRPGDRILQFVSMAFDACIEEIFPPLLAGATIVFRDDEMISSIEVFLERCAAMGITILLLPTAYWHELVDAMVRDGLALPTGIRVVTAGGEEMRADRVADWRRLPAAAHVRLVNEYGPTETTVVATVDELAGPRSDADAPDEPTVGRPLPGVRFRVVDPSGADVPAGEDGELLLGGPIVANGYLGQPELTAERFSTGADGVRYYRTGDRVRLRPDGRLGFRGRMDRQVKVRGFRVEPAEVERALLAHPAVRDAAVHLDRERAMLTAYLITNGSDLGGLRAHLSEHLPAHAVPSLLIPVDAFPRNARDKVDFTALAVPAVVGTGTEVRVAAIVAEVLGPAGNDDSLFELGAHSLSLVQISTRITREFGIRLPLADLHVHPTIAGLARLLDEREPEQADEVTPVAADAVLPLTSFQRDTWLAEQFHPGTALHTIGLRYRITGPVSAAQVGAALDAIVARHDALRAVFRADGDEPVMVFGGPARQVPLEVHDLSGLPADEKSARADQLRHERGQTVFDPAAGDLIAASLIDDELVVAVHHLVFDGWSATVFAQDLADLLAGAEPPPARTYASHLARQANSEIAHWVEQLTGLDTDVLVPADRGRPAVRSFRGGLIERPVDPALFSRIEQTARSAGTSTATAVLTALQTLLARLTGHTDITVLSPVAHRTDPGHERTVGAFITVVPLRTDLSGDPDFRTALARANDTVLDALAHDDPPMAELPAALGLPGRADRGPLTQVMLIVQNTPPAVARNGGTGVAFVGGTHPGMTKLDLTVSVDFPDGTPVLLVEYAAELFDPATVERFADQLLTLLDAATTDPAQRIGALPLLSPTGRAQLLAAASAPAGAPLPDAGFGVQRLIAAQDPGAIAISLGAEQWTYQRLNAEAADLAAALTAAGVTRGDRVGICLPRSPRAFAAVLAAWRVGAAYVPVDPDYPPERQRYLLADGDVRAVLHEPLPSGARTAPADEAREDDPAYVLYTSGTTGMPKGVVVSHANLRHAVAGWREAYDLRPGMVHLQAAGFSFDVFAGETLRALATGGHLVVCPKETVLDPAALHTLLREKGVQVAELVPTVLRGLFDHLERTGGDLSFLRLLAGGAEKWYAGEYRRAQALVGAGGRVVNSYGVTEATIDNAYFEGQVDGLAANTPLPIGRPYPGNRLYVLDAHREPVPYGTTGELWIGGTGVALGYHARPELTAARFAADPFAPEPGARMYATGDVARLRADGTVDLLGRRDDQVKVNGHRIELGEVEAALAGLPGVRAAAADVRGTQLIGYAVPTGLDPVELRQGLQRLLPHFSVPARVLTLDALPLNPSGKVDRRALPDPVEIKQETPLETPTQEGLARIWATVLRREQISPDHGFFELGGDSFSALRMARAVDKEYGVRIALLDLYRNSVLRDLAAHLDTLIDPVAPAAEDGRWLHRLSRGTAPPTAGTLVCLPYSGGHALSFEPLASHMPPGWVVHALQIPGRDWSRPDEPSPSFDEIIDHTLAEVRALPGPIYLYGHCHGSALTIELARRIEAAGLPLKGVAVGAMFPMARLPGKVFDWIYRHFQPDRLVSDRAVLDEIRALGGGFDEFADPAERAFAMRSVRHDERGSEEFYAHTLRDHDGPVLQAPLLSVVGDRDRVTELYHERHLEWQHYASRVSLEVIPKAGHGFLKHHAAQLAAVLVKWSSAPPPEPVAATVAGPEPSLRRFSVVAAGQFVSLVGSALSQLVMSLWVFQQTGRITDFAFISAVALLPGILAGPFAGAVADRYDRRKVMIASDGAAGLSTIVLIALMSFGDLHMWQVYALCGLTSLASAFQRPAYAAAISQLVPKAFLGQANGIAQLGAGAGALFAPMIAAPLLALFELPTLLLIDVATFLVAVVTLQLVRFPDRAFKRREETMRAQLRNGWRFITKRPGLVSALWFFTIDHIFYTAGFALIVPLILIEHDVATLSLVLSAGGLGALVGSLAMSVWGGTRRRTDGMIIFMAVNNVGLIVVGLFTEPWLIVLGMFTMSATESIINGHWMSLIQAKVGLELQGRVLSIFMTVMMLTMPLGYVLIGPAADHYFRPLLAPGGALAGHLGPILGTGPGRGLALVIITTGLVMTAWAIRGWYNRRLRFVEDDLPDVSLSGDIEDRDTLQRAADAKLTRVPAVAE